MAGTDPNNDPGTVNDSGISARWVGVPDEALTAGAGGAEPGVATAVPTVAERFNMKVGGALDLAQMPVQIAPLDQTSAYRIGRHAGLGDPTVPDVAPLDKPMPDVQPAQLSADMRYEYGRQLQAGDVDSPQDFAERTAAGAWKDATWNDPAASFDTHAAQVTNAGRLIASSLPTDDETTVVAATLARDTGQPINPTTVGGIRGNLLDAYGATGKSPMQLLREANIDSDIQTALSTPVQRPVNYPTMEELSVKGRDAVQDPLGNMTKAPMGEAVNALGETFLQLVGGLNPDNYMAAASHITGADVKHYFDVDLKPGEKIEQGGETVAENKAEPPTARDVAQFVATHLLNGPPAEATGALGAGPSYGALLRSVSRGISLDDARQITADREAAQANIRANQGIRNFEQAMTKQALQGLYKTFDPLVAPYLKWVKQFHQDNATVATHRDAWVAQGGDPARFSEISPTGELTANYPAIQAFFDHVENRPGGARIDPKSPLYPAAQTIQEELAHEKELLQRDVSNTMGFVEDYYPHNWLDPRAKVEQAFPEIFGSGRQGSGFHLRERQLPTIFEGLQRGLTPKFPNPIEATLHYKQQVSDFRMAERVRNQAIEHDGAYYARSPKAPDDRPLNGRAATRLRVFNDAEGNAQAYIEKLYAPRGFATVYNNWIGRGIRDWPGGEYLGPLYDKILMAKNASLGMAFGLSGFHPFVMMKQGMASAFGQSFGDVKAGEIGRALYDAGFGALGPGEAGRLVFSRGARDEAVYLGTAKDATAEELRLRDYWIKSGGVSPMQGRGEPYFASQARNLFTDWQRAGAAGVARSVGRSIASVAGQVGESKTRRYLLSIPRAVGAITENFGRVSDTIMSPLFDIAIPRMKRAVWSEEMEQYIRQNPAASEGQILRAGRQIMDSMDDRFGEMNMDNVFWPRAIKQIAQVATVSQGWEYGTARAVGRGLEDLTTAPQGARFTARARALLGYVVAMGFASSVYQYLKTGTTPFSTGAWNFATPLSRASDPYSAVQLPGEEKEGVRLYSLFKQAGSDPAKWLGALAQYVGGKAQPLVQDVQAILHNRGTTDLLKKLLSHHQPSFMWNNSPNADIGWFERALGIHSAPNAVTGASTVRVPRGSSSRDVNDQPRERPQRSEHSRERHNSHNRRNRE